MKEGDTVCRYCFGYQEGCDCMFCLSS
jgi:hypothetical protein